jgi:hypothetical protein
MNTPTIKTITVESMVATKLTSATLPGQSPATYLMIYTSNTSPIEGFWRSPPVSYTFIGSAERYEKIFSAQCSRVGSIINDSLQQLDRTDDDYNETFVDEIARLIDLMGEPAFFTAALEAKCFANDTVSLEPLLLAIATARNKETEEMRLELVKTFAERSDFKAKRAAVRALGRFNSVGAKALLRDISANSGRSEIALMASSLAK